MTEKALANPTIDEVTREAAVHTLWDAYAPYHAMIVSWMNAMHPPAPRAWDPDHDTIDLITSEVTQAHKDLRHIQHLEAKLKGKNPNTEYGLDFEHLSRLKKDLGMPVDFKTKTEEREEKRAADAGWDPNDPKWKKD